MNAMNNAYLVQRATRSSRVGLALLGVLVLLLASLPFWADRALLRLVVEFAYYLALAQMWNLLAGYAGMVSVGQQAFVGLGGYLLFVLASQLGVPPLAAVFLSGLVVALLWGFDRVRSGAGLLWPAVLSVAAVAVWVGIGSWTSGHRARARARAIAEYRRDLIDPIARQLDVHLGRKLRSVLRRRSGVTAAATELNLALAELERRLGSA